MTEKIAAFAAQIDHKPPRSTLASFVLERYGNGDGFLATTEDVDLARKLFAHAAQAEIELLTGEEQPRDVAI
jgi:hypothetical protein